MEKTFFMYYFSGTGNSRIVAEKIIEVSKEHEYNSTLIDIGKTDRLNIIKPTPGSVIGFCSPTHGFNYPPILIYYLLRFPKSQNNKVFLMNTRAGMKLYKLFLPGLSGIALLLAAVILLIKGYKIIGMRSIDLPSNWISLHPGLRDKVVLSIRERCLKRTETFARKIFTGGKSYRALYDIVQDLLIAPISIGYFLMGRFIIAKTFYANSDCTKCDLCIKSCPVKAIKKVSTRPFWTYHCESCMHCMNICPHRAIETNHGLLAATIFVFSFLMNTFFWKWIDSVIKINNSNIRSLLETALFFVFFVLVYRLMHYVLHLPVIRQLIEYTSFTHYKFWRRYKLILKWKKEKSS